MDPSRSHVPTVPSSSAQPTVVKDVKQHGATPDLPQLSVRNIEQELAVKAMNDKRLAPLLSLMLANEQEHSAGSPAAKTAHQDIKTIDNHSPKRVEDKIKTSTIPFDQIPNAQQLGINQVILDSGKPLDFNNWGTTVTNTPDYTLVVNKIKGVEAVVQWAAKERKRIRMAGFRHSWTNIFGQTGDVVVMFMPFECLVDLPFKPPPTTWQSELTGINVVDSVAGVSPKAGHAFVKIMAGTTNSQLREWCFAQKTLCMPFNVIMLEVTFGGTNAPICHGSSFSSTTLSDLVAEVSYVDAHGVVQTVNDPQELRAASGAFGLLGIVVSLTLQLESMGIAELVPVKLPMPLAIPPPAGYAIPEAVQEQLNSLNIKVDGPEMAQARLDFIKRCDDDYYLEWFWFPYQSHCWVNTWKKRPVNSGDVNVQEYPGEGFINGTTAQERQESLVEVLVDSWPFQHLISGYHQAYALGLASMVALPNVTSPADTIETFVSEALHFRRGIQNFRCWDTEWEIPIPGLNGKRDYAVIQRAWWDGITAMYADPKAPVRVALEMRLTGSSNVLLAPQRNNMYGTVSIEALTTLATGDDIWKPFCQVVADKWTSYKHPVTGTQLLSRPHWAKQWQGLNVHGKPVEDYLSQPNVYGDAFKEFKSEFESIVQKRGGTVAETLSRFGDPTMAKLIFGNVTPQK